jgi:hypothetical protein
MKPSRRFPGGVSAAAEAWAFSAGVLVYIWALRRLWPSSAWVLALAMLLALRLHADTLASLGLEFRTFLTAARRWRLGWLVLAAGTVWLSWRGRLTPLDLRAAAYYFVRCVVQQLVYQNLVAKRLTKAMGNSWKPRAIAAALFGAAHIPNPALVPATLVWGYWSIGLFERRPSVPALGLAQFLFSTALFWLTPLDWNRNFRVGPAYFAWRLAAR